MPGFERSGRAPLWTGFAAGLGPGPGILAGMFRATLRGLQERLLRSVLCVVAIVLGCALASGTSVLGATVNESFDKLFATRNAGIDVLVRAPAAFEGETGGFVARAPVPADVVEVVQSAPGVARAAGTLIGYAQLVGKDGKAIESQGPPTFGIGWIDDPVLNQFKLATGRAPGSGEIVIDVAAARDHGFAVGEDVTVVTAGGSSRFRLVGTARFGADDGIARTTATLFSAADATRVMAKTGFDTVAVSGREGVAPSALEPQVQAALDARFGPQRYETVLGSAAAAEQSAAVKDYFSFVTKALAAFAVAALFVGGFLILNTFTITLTQRTRELALLRALGASRGQVFAAQIVEATALGLIAGTLGAVSGIALAAGLRALFSVAGATLPGGELAVSVVGLVQVAIIGTAVTIVAALYPSWRATTVPPIVAIGDDAVQATRRPLARVIIGAVATTAGGLLIVQAISGSGGNGLTLLGLGALLGFIGLAALSVLLVRPLATIVGGPPFAGVLAIGGIGVVGFAAAAAVRDSLGIAIAVLSAAAGIGLAVCARSGAGLSGRLGQRNTSRSPRRSSATAAALMVGVGLVTFTAVVASSLKASADAAVAGGVRADLLLTNDQGEPIGGSLGTKVDTAAGQAGATGTTNLSYSKVRLAMAAPGEMAPAALTGRPRDNVVGVDPSTFALGFDLGTASAKVPSLTDAPGRPVPIILSSLAAADLGATTGAAMWVEMAGGSPTAATVVAVDGDTRALRNAAVVIDRAAVTRLTGSLSGLGDAEGVDVIGIRVAPGGDLVTVRTAVEGALTNDPQIAVRDQQEVRARTAEQVNSVLVLVNVLLGLSVVVAMLGVANTVGLSVVERRREIGLLRAVGMQRVQVRRMVRWEAVSVSAIGALLGVGIGCVLGVAGVRALADEGLRELDIPVGQLVVVVVAAALAGAVAGWLPARRAAGVDPVVALQSN